MQTTKLTKFDLNKIRSYSKKLGYNVFYDNKKHMTCIVNPKTKRRVFVYKDNHRYVVVNDANYKENINMTLELCLDDRLGLNLGIHKHLRKFAYGIISIEY